MSQEVKVGDIVGRRSYNSDTMFRIEEIVGDTAYLKGIFFRLTADAPISDLEIISREEYQRAEQVEFDQYRTILPPVMNQMRSYDNGDFYISGRKHQKEMFTTNKRLSLLKKSRNYNYKSIGYYPMAE